MTSTLGVSVYSITVNYNGDGNIPFRKFGAVAKS